MCFGSMIAHISLIAVPNVMLSLAMGNTLVQTKLTFSSDKWPIKIY